MQVDPGRPRAERWTIATPRWRREAQRAKREHRIARECDRRHAYALGDPALVAAALPDEYDDLDDSNVSEHSSDTSTSDDKESVVSFVAARKPRADRDPASAKRTDAVWSATSPREKDDARVASPREGLREFYGVNYFAMLALEEACRRCAPPLRYQDPALTMNAEQARRYREEHPEQFTAMLPEDEPGAVAAAAADLGRPRLGSKGVEGAALERRSSASSSPRGSIGVVGARGRPEGAEGPECAECRRAEPRCGRPDEQPPVGRAARAPDRAPGRRRGVSRAGGGRRERGSPRDDVWPRESRASSSSHRGGSETAASARPPTPAPPPPRLRRRAARLLELMWDPDGCPGGLPFSLANADKLARRANRGRGARTGVVRDDWHRRGGERAPQHLCRLLRASAGGRCAPLEAHAPRITEMARDAEEAEANARQSRAGAGTERRSANDGRRGGPRSCARQSRRRATMAKG